MHVQHVEYGVGISAEEQPDILDIQSNYINDEGNFWIGTGLYQALLDFANKQGFLSLLN